MPTFQNHFFPTSLDNIQCLIIDESFMKTFDVNLLTEIEVDALIIDLLI